MTNCIERDIFVLRDASSVAQPIEYVQGTNAIPILLRLRDYTIKAGSTARVYVHRPSTSGEYDVAIIEGNNVKIDVKDTMFTEVGKNSLQICIVNGEDTLVTFSYPVMVKNNHVPGITTPSQNHSDFLDEYISNMQSATDSANDAAEKAAKSANEANEALEAFKEALEGTVINDETPSSVTTYSSEKIEMFDIQTTTDTTLHNTKPGGLRLTGVTGKTEQKNYPGYQLFDASKLPTKSAGGVTVTNNGDGSFTISGSGELSAAFASLYELTHEETISLLKEGILYANFGGAPSQPWTYVQLLQNNVVMISIINDGTSNQVRIPQDVLDDDTTYLRFGFYGALGSTIVPGAVKPMFYQEGDGTWEPYCGGQPAPNPQYPIAIENTFDCVKMMQGGISTSSGAWYTSSLNVSNKRQIPCKQGDIVKLVLESVRNIRILWYNESGFISYSGGDSISEVEVTAPSGATYFNYSIGNATAITPATVGKISLTINGKCVGQIVEHGKNLLDCRGLETTTINGVTFTPYYNEKNELEYINVYGTSTGTAILTIPINLKVGEYILNGCPSDGSNESYRLDIYNTSLSYADKGKGVTFSLDTDITANIRVRIASGVNISNLKFYPMIREVGTDPTYEPYTEKVATIFLDEQLREGDGLVKVDGVIYENHRRSTDVFDGSDDEGWIYESSNDVSTIYKFIGDMAKPYANHDTSKLVCDKFTQNTTSNTPIERVNKFMIFPNNAFQIYLPSGTFTDLASGKAWLANNPITVEYELAEETLTPLDAASQLTLNGLETFNGVTYLEVDSKIPPSGIEVEYGTSQVGAYTLKGLLNSESSLVNDAANKARIEELAVAIVATGSEV